MTHLVVEVISWKVGVAHTCYVAWKKLTDDPPSEWSWPNEIQEVHRYRGPANIFEPLSRINFKPATFFVVFRPQSGSAWWSSGLSLDTWTLLNFNVLCVYGYCRFMNFGWKNMKHMKQSYTHCACPLQSLYLYNSIQCNSVLKQDSFEWPFQ